LATRQQQDAAEQLEQFLKNGGTVEQIPRGQSGYREGESRSAWGAPRKKAPAAEKPAAKKG